MAAAFVELTNVSRVYKTRYDSVTAVRDVDLSIQAGERLALLGRSGSGKSTLLNLLGGLDHPTAGDIRVGRHFLNHMSSEEMAEYRLHSVGMIFQAFNLVRTLTALQNVELPLVFDGQPRSSRRRAAHAALEEVGLSARRRHRPDQLSGGEQQRVAIARAMVCQPTLLLADEPTGNLDSSTAADIMQQLGRYAERQQAAVVLVTHDEELAGRFAERILRMRDGQLSESPEPCVQEAS